MHRNVFAAGRGRPWLGGVSRLALLALPLAVAAAPSGPAAAQDCTIPSGNATVDLDAVCPGPNALVPAGSTVDTSGGGSPAITEQPGGLVFRLTNRGALLANVQTVDLLDPGSAVINFGSIFSNTTGVRLQGGGSVDNAGSISSNGASGIDILAAGAVVNRAGATITAGGTAGVNVSGGTGAVDNAGTITGGGFGVQFLAGGAVTNRAGGTVSSSPLGGAGVSVAGGAGAIDNAGSISGGGNGISLQAGGSLANRTGATVASSGPAVNISGGSGAVVNEAGATIQSPASVGVIFGGVGSLDNAGAIIGFQPAVLLNGGGTLINRAGGTILSNGASLSVQLSGGGSIDNAGTIRAASASPAVVVNNGAAVTNRAGGTIVSDAGTGLTFSGATPSTVANAGTITGGGGTAITFGSDDDLLVLQTGSVLNGDVNASGDTTVDVLRLEGSGFEDSNFLNFEDLVVRATGEWTLAGGVGVSTTFEDGNPPPAGIDVTVETGRLNVNRTLQGDTLVGPQGTLGGNGVVNAPVLNQGVVSPGASAGAIGVLTFTTGSVTNPPYQQIATGTLETEIGSGGSDRLDVIGPYVGAATLDGTAAFRFLSLAVPAETVFLTYTTRAGVFSAVTSSTAFFEPAVVYDPTQARVIVNRRPFSDFGGSGNQQAVGEGLEAAFLANPEALANQAALLGIASRGEALAFFDRLSGDSIANLDAGTIQTLQTLLGLVFARLDDAGAGTQTASAPFSFDGRQLAYAGEIAQLLDDTGADRVGTAGPRRGFGGWLRGFGAWQDVDDDGNGGEVDAASGGVALGFDRRLAPGLLAGISLGYARTDADFDDRDAEGEADSYVASLYGRVERGHLSVDGLVGYAFNDFETERDIPGAGTAEADFDGHSALAGLEAGYDLAPVAGIDIRPVAGLRYVGLWREGFEEDGAGVFALDVDDEDTQSLRSHLGVEASAGVPVGGVVLVPEARAAWEHEFLDDNAELEASFVGVPGAASFSVEGTEVARDAAVLGLGVSTRAGRNVSVFVDYDGRFSGDVEDHAVSGGLRVAW